MLNETAGGIITIKVVGNVILFVLLLNLGYMVKYSLLPLGDPSDKRLYLTICPLSRHNMDTVYTTYTKQPRCSWGCCTNSVFFSLDKYLENGFPPK